MKKLLLSLAALLFLVPVASKADAQTIVVRTGPRYHHYYHHRYYQRSRYWRHHYYHHGYYR